MCALWKCNKINIIFPQCPEQTKVHPPEIQGRGFLDPFFISPKMKNSLSFCGCCVQDEVQALHLPPVLLCKQQVQWGTIPGRLAWQLCQEFIFHTCQGLHILSPLHCAEFPADFQQVKISQKNFILVFFQGNKYMQLNVV